MEKVILVNPPLTLKDRYGSFDLGGTEMPPLGLTNLAAMLRKHGFCVEIIDGEALHLTCEEIAELILEKTPLFVGFTSVALSIHKTAKIASLIKSKNPSIKTVVGGPHLTAVPGKTFEMFSQLDIGVIGEGDITIVELAESINSKNKLHEVKGLLIREDGKLCFTEPRPLIENLDILPLPAWDLLPKISEHYIPPLNSYNRSPVGFLVTTRGCYAKCNYCSRAVYQNTVRQFSAEYIVKMIEDLQNNYKIKEIVFEDDEFLTKKDRVIKLYDLFKEKKINLSWSCLTRINKANPDILKMMKEMGCWQISYGIESGNQEVLNFLKKGTNLRKIEETIAWTKDAGIIPKGFFMIGHPVDTKETILDTINFAKKLALIDFQVSIFTPLPGSEIYKDAHKYGWFDDNWEKMNYWNILFIPKGLSAEELRAFQKKAFREFYLRPKIIISHISRLRSKDQLLKLTRAFFALLKFLLFEKKK